MKPFMMIAIPHSDILEGKLSMDIFAADIWQVFKSDAPDEYQNPDAFFRKTFMSTGLKNLIAVAEKRLKGEGGDPVIQLQTPFGGGKTHSLIALYHKAREWQTRVAVIDGTVFDPKDRTLWEEMEFQLTGKIQLLAGKTSPGREKLQNLFTGNQPLLILIDELLQYAVKAAGIKVGDSNLASQTLAFLQELTTAVKNLDRALLIFTLPSSLLEHFDEHSEKLFQQIQHLTGRMEKVYTPVQDEEVSQIIVKRLFSEVRERSAKNNIDKFLEYAERENILPGEMDKSYYRGKFIKSFPFQPEVIDVLYKRWGSFPGFQRTRGVLRILALVVHSLKDSKNPFIRLGDIDLKNETIRRELIKHIGSEYDSIVAADITADDAGAKKVDWSLGSAYESYSFGTKCATTIFMYSFSGGPERGLTLNEIKLCCADPEVPSSIIAEAVQKLREHLYYISDVDYFFTNQPNLNRILLTKAESIDDREIEIEEKELIKASLARGKFEVYIWPEKSRDIPDTRSFKLCILKEYSKEKCSEFLENCGERPRIYRNTLIFLCPSEDERFGFNKISKDKLAWQLIERDRNLRLTDEQKREVRNRIEKIREDAKTKLRTLYRLVLLPAKDGFREIDLGIPTYGKESSLDEEIYNRLRGDEILEKLSPLALGEKYLKNDFVSTKTILESLYKTPGEVRIVDIDVYRSAIKEGVKQGLFGLGKLENDKAICDCFREECFPQVTEDEVIIKAELCQKREFHETAGTVVHLLTTPAFETSQAADGRGRKDTVAPARESYREIHIQSPVPLGKLSDIAGIIKYLNSRFSRVEVKLEISARDGAIGKSEYEDKIRETFKQVGVNEAELKENLK